MNKIKSILRSDKGVVTPFQRITRLPGVHLSELTWGAFSKKFGYNLTVCRILLTFAVTEPVVLPVRSANGSFFF